MENFTDFLSGIGINIPSELKRYEDVKIEKVCIKKSSETFVYYLATNKILSREKLEETSNRMKKLIGDKQKNILLVQNIRGIEKKNAQDIFEKYWDTIYYIIKKAVPSVVAYADEIEHIFIDKTLKIKFPTEFLYNRVSSKDVEKSILYAIEAELGMSDIEIYMEVAKRNINEKKDIDTILKKREDEINEVIFKMDIDNEEEPEEEKEDRYVVERVKDPSIFYGDNVDALYCDINDITGNMKTVLIEGEIFSTEERETKNGRELYTLYLRDKTGAIACKMQLNDLEKDSIKKNAKKNEYIKLKGDIIKNYFTGELEISITGMKKENEVKRKDNATEKRVELHAHTQMSAMDGVAPVKSLVKTAKKWEHKAIAITDHGVVQGFPDAMNEAGNDIKILYGVEAYLVDDSQDIIHNANDLSLDQPFVVFDIETTGLSPINDNITEIGAVRIENGKKVSEFSEFVNPEMDISYKIQQLTRITNEMVENKDTIDKVLPRFIEFCKGAVLVAHNADFDTGFITKKASDLGIECNFEKIDTLMLARLLLPQLKRFSLDRICKHFGIDISGHHRAVYDAEATSKVFIEFLEMFRKKGVVKLSDVNRIYGKIDYTKLRPTHATIYAKNYTGLKNLYRLISDSHVEHFYKEPRILKSILEEHREGLILGSACSGGEVYNAVKRGLDDAIIKEIIDYYDFLEIMPNRNNYYMIEEGEVKDEEELKEINRKILRLGDECGKLVVATGDVHMLEPEEQIYRDILKHSQGYGYKKKSRIRKKKDSLYFMTTDEMLREFSYLGEEDAYRVVVKNSNAIADMFEKILPIPKETFPPIIEGSEEQLREMCNRKAEKIYGSPLPDVVRNRLDRELNSIISNGYAVMYIIASDLVRKSLSDGYLVGSRGSVGSSLAATMSDITEVNPLPAHYVCPNPECKHSEFFEIGEWGSGIDLPDKDCPVCGTKMIKDGHDIPFEVFLGFEGDKEPDIDLNFSGVYQPTIHKYTEELFGEGYTYRAGTIGTVKEKTAYGYVMKFVEENDMDCTQAEMLRLSLGCTGVKRTTGQHPGGVMVIPKNKDVHDFTPIQFPANDKTSGVKTTHFDYHSISGRILKLDILGHDGPTIIRMLEEMTGIKITDIPLDDPKTMSLFTSTEALGVTPEEIGTTVGSLAIPEFGTKFTRAMLVDTKPTTFAELVRIAGLSHGTDVWLNNAQDLVRAKVVGLKDVISTRDDIMNYLIFKGLEPKMAFTIMESVRKGKGLKPEHEEAMKKNDVPDWYISSCKKIKYMFPKAHAVAYVMTSFRIAYCKVNYPEAFYATYFTTKVDDFDIDLVTSGIENVKARMEEIQSKGVKATAKEQSQYSVLEVVVEMYARGIEFLKIDIYESSADEFIIKEKGKILPPMISLQGLGENAAKSVVEARKDGEFISKEDLIKRTKISKTVVEKLTEHGSLENMSEKNQLSLFNV